MAQPTITGLAQAGYDLHIDVENGVLSVPYSCNAETVSNLVRARINSKIDWRNARDRNIDLTVYKARLSVVISNTYGVTSADLSGFNPVIYNGTLNIGSICFTHECGNTRETCYV